MRSQAQEGRGHRHRRDAVTATQTARAQCEEGVLALRESAALRECARARARVESRLGLEGAGEAEHVVGLLKVPAEGCVRVCACESERGRGRE